jgi:hypothetical protein
MKKKKTVEDMQHEIDRLKKRIPKLIHYEFHKLAGECQVRINQLMKRIMINERKLKSRDN